MENWDNAFSAMEAYAYNLAALKTLDFTKSFEVTRIILFKKFSETATYFHTNANSPTSVVNAALATEFTEAGTKLISNDLHSTAREIAAASDPNLQKILSLLADEIGADQRSPGIRSTLFRICLMERGELKADFWQAKSESDKRIVAQRYVQLLKESDKQDELLLELRRSLLALVDAHHALARGNASSVQASLQIIGDGVQRSHELLDQLDDERKREDLRPATAQ